MSSGWTRWRAHRRELRDLGDHLLAERSGPSTWLNRLGYGFRLAWHRSAHQRLLAAFGPDAEGPEWAEVLAANPRLGFKVLHPCHHVGLTVEQRVDRVIAHHHLARRLFGAELFRQAHIQPEGALLCQVALPGGKELLPVRLNRFPPYWREGELTMALYDLFGSLLYTQTFSLQGTADGGAGLLIGSLIGVASLDNIRHLTRLMQGLRPQSLMVFVAQALCDTLGLAELTAVGRAGHVFAGTDRASRLQFDYDAFWIELGGTPMDASARIYQLPPRFTPRPETDIPGHKRAQYRRRYAMLAALSQDIAARCSLAPGTDDPHRPAA